MKLPLVSAVRAVGSGSGQHGEAAFVARASVL